MVLRTVWLLSFLFQVVNTSLNEDRLLTVIPILPTFCATYEENSEPYYVALTVNGEVFRVLIDTGSSNLAIAADACTSCSVSPKYSGPISNKTNKFQISYGTGSTFNVEVEGVLAVGHLRSHNATFSAIIAQDRSFGFDLFPNRNNKECYNTYAGLWGLAYQGQDAGPLKKVAARKLSKAKVPKLVSKVPKGTTNGTSVPYFDQLVSKGVPNAFTVEICHKYPLNCHDHYRRDNTTWAPSSKCGGKPVGSLILGGYDSTRLVSPMEFTPISVEIHYDVTLLGVRVCGNRGCENVKFPDPINGKSEDDCKCSTETCEKGSVDYCYFTVLDTGSDHIFMNTAANAKALVETMKKVEMVSFTESVKQIDIEHFYFNKTAIPNGLSFVSPNASFEMAFPRKESINHEVEVIWQPVQLDAIFQRSNDGMRQNGIFSDLETLSEFSVNKIPTLLGDVFFKGKVVYHDRSRKRIGFGLLRPELCGVNGDDMSNNLPSRASIDKFGLNSKATPGIGCQRGTGSGGGCD